MSKVVRHLKDDIYQYIEITDEPYTQIVLEQGTLKDIQAYIFLEKRELL